MKGIAIFLGIVSFFYNVPINATESADSDKPVIRRIICDNLAEDEANESYRYQSFDLRVYIPSDLYLRQYGTWYHYTAEFLDGREIRYLYEDGFLFPKYSPGEEYLIAIPGATNDSQKIRIKKTGETWDALFLGRDHFVDCSVLFY